MSVVLGLDVGTGSLKGILVDKKGEVVASSSSSYDFKVPLPGYAEQNPEIWLTALDEVLQTLSEVYPSMKTHLKGVATSGQMHSLVLLDKDSEVLRNAILWNDVRTTQQTETITHQLGQELINITQNRALEGFTLPKILWVQENEPEIWEQVEKFMLPKDYINFVMTGTATMDYSDAAGTLMLDMNTQKWSAKIANEFNISEDIYPELVDSSGLVGYMTEEMKQRYGLVGQIPIYSGGADNACGAIGSGIVSQETALLSTGTSGVYLSIAGEASSNETGNIHYFNHVVPNTRYLMGVTLAAGYSYQWFKDNFAKDKTFEELNQAASQSSVGAKGLIFAPYLMGERTPHFDSQVRGAFLKMSAEHTFGDFARSVLEGVTYSLKQAQENVLEAGGDKPSKLIAVGGGAKSSLWQQIQADIFNSDIYVLKEEEGPAYGAAIIAAVGSGLLPDFETAVNDFVEIKKVASPHSESVRQYAHYYQTYVQAYPKLADFS